MINTTSYTWQGKITKCRARHIKITVQQDIMKKVNGTHQIPNRESLRNIYNSQ